MGMPGFFLQRAGSSRVEKGLSSRQQRETKTEQSTPAAKRLTAASPAACFSGVPMSPAAAGAPPLAASAFRRSENCRGVSKPPHLYGMPMERMPGFHHAPASSPAAEASGVSVRMPSPSVPWRTFRREPRQIMEV
ncbi:MAG: hypothetical protein ACLTL9_08800 [Akkermansia muciniphila]|uniref:hypothetical protein n=2 Tax=Akkermansia TaxID=239934 RepID=UPI002366FDE0|nr:MULTISPECIES: hypothetical protein [Akkermansia]MCP2382120.1 hypothetical protein [Akkermansia muciniphila]